MIVLNAVPPLGETVPEAAFLFGVRRLYSKEPDKGFAAATTRI
jgi:hypothetical protein